MNSTPQNSTMQHVGNGAGVASISHCVECIACVRMLDTYMSRSNYFGMFFTILSVDMVSAGLVGSSILRTDRQSYGVRIERIYWSVQTTV